MNKRRWSEAEKAVVKEHYSDLSTKRLTEAIPDRSVGSIYDMAGRMGLGKSEERIREMSREMSREKKPQKDLRNG